MHPSDQARQYGERSDSEGLPEWEAGTPLADLPCGEGWVGEQWCHCGKPAAVRDPWGGYLCRACEWDRAR